MTDNILNFKKQRTHSVFVKAFSARSPRIRHRRELNERDWENAVQGLGKHLGTWAELASIC